LHAFASKGSNDGESPAIGNLVFDAGGNIYGTTWAGGTYGAGTVYKLTPNGKKWNESVILSFDGNQGGAYPYGVIVDSSHVLYGVTWTAGLYGYGTVYEISPKGRQKTLYSFTGGSDGWGPNSSLVEDQQGDFYGLTTYGGHPGCNAGHGCGVIFEISK
jgi:uncharacterized repeat protein (TIGR03803 family)